MALVEAFGCAGSGPGLHLVVTAGIHGDEPEGVEAVRRLISETKSLDLNGRITFVPVANKSAYRRGSRVGADGLDLARTFPGKMDGSITERTAHALSKLIRTADLYLDLHTGGKAMQIEPLVGYMLVADSTVLEKERQMAQAFGLPITWGTSSKLEGRSLSVARDSGIPAIFAEYLGGSAFSQPGVEAYVEGCRNIMRWAGMVSGSPLPTKRPTLAIEDDRPDSGHLQICHPSPTRGVFSPRVKLGQILTKGAEIGQVVDGLDDGGNIYPVIADCSGRLICLRVEAEVEKGDGLAVILETDRQIVIS